jgi:hypothetical protein
MTVKEKRTTIKNHYLPRFYLKGFGDISVSNIFTGEINKTSPDTVGYEKYLYNDDVEHGVLENIDRCTSELFFKYKIGQFGHKIPFKLDERDKFIFAQFLCSMYARVPYTKQRISSIDNPIENILSDIRNSFEYSEIKFYFGLKQAEQWLTKTAIQVKSTIDCGDYRFNHYLKSEIFLNNAQKICNFKWTWLKCDNNQSFIVGDNPFVRWGNGGGFSIKQAENTFPISKQLSLLIDRKYLRQNIIRANSNMVKILNHRQRCASIKIVVGNSKELSKHIYANIKRANYKLFARH